MAQFRSSPKGRITWRGIPNPAAEMNSNPGTYALVLHSKGSWGVQVGRWGCLDVRRGYYLYVGSALGPGGVKARVARHCREPKARHWHIDYLREFAAVTAVWYRHSPQRLEHRWARAAARLDGFEQVGGFGCTDCLCASHLFFSATEPRFDLFSAAAGGSAHCESLRFPCGLP
jgi:Uri superfamily endonuclease